jgi:putative NADH-flavin reductase
MKIAVFGGTGGTGQEIVAQSLAKGYHVSVLVRDPGRLSDQFAAQLYVTVGDVLDFEKVEKTVWEVDAVVVSLGTRPDSPENIVSEGTKNIIQAMQEQGVKRLVVVTSLGVGDSKNQVPFAFKMIMKTALRKVMADKERQENLVRESDLDWVIVRPGGLTDGPRKGEYAFGIEPSIVAGSISRADLAEFVLKQVVENQFLRKAVAVT